MSSYLYQGLIIVVLAIPVSLSCWALLDAARRPSWAWAFAERSQVLWMALILAGVLMVPLGVVVSSVYLTRIRPHVARVEAGQISH